MIRLYGIANCDKVKGARAWLEQHGLKYEFHDFRKAGLDAELVGRWYNRCQGSLINRRSTTWRNLDRAQQTLTSGADAIALLVEHPTLIQRPVLESNGNLLINYSDRSYSEFFD